MTTIDLMTDAELDHIARQHRRIYESLVRAGFGKKEAITLLAAQTTGITEAVPHPESTEPEPYPELTAEQAEAARGVVRHGMELLDFDNDPVGALSWWNEPNNALGDVTPYEALMDDTLRLDELTHAINEEKRGM